MVICWLKADKDNKPEHQHLDSVWNSARIRQRSSTWSRRHRHCWRQLWRRCSGHMTEIHMILIFLSLPPPKEGGYVFIAVCVSVCGSGCLCAKYFKIYERILMTFLEMWAWTKDQSIRFWCRSAWQSWSRIF